MRFEVINPIFTEYLTEIVFQTIQPNIFKSNSFIFNILI